MNQKVIYNIAKKRVVGATRITDEIFKNFEHKKFNDQESNNFSLWTLTQDDYIVALKRDGTYLDLGTSDGEYICFICY